MTRRKEGKRKLQWRRADLHLHTSASIDFQEPEVSYLDILTVAERRGLDIIAFTDHNTVAGYRQMVEEIQQLELLEQLGRLRNEEEKTLKEYRRLLKQVLVLPGFEFTALSVFTFSASSHPIRACESWSSSSASSTSRPTSSTPAAAKWAQRPTC